MPKNSRGVRLRADDAVTFLNVRVTISGVATIGEAYDRLCEGLASLETETIGVEWETDEYEVNGTTPVSTTALFPRSESDEDHGDD